MPRRGSQAQGGRMLECSWNAKLPDTQQRGGVGVLLAAAMRPPYTRCPCLPVYDRSRGQRRTCALICNCLCTDVHRGFSRA